MGNTPWWQETVVYQIYPRSFKDSNGDGIGDLQGIISKLDYLQEMGFETLWISPFFESPQEDFGYDIADYRSIASEYGTMEDFGELVSEVHKRNMYLILDMVLNHTSREHSWFKESRSSKDNPKRDWYIWKPGKKPPNNWKSMVYGRGWHFDSQTNEWYWAAFLPCQPDLNWRNPEVYNEMLSILKYWLDKDVDGFRLDIFGAIYEDPEFQNNPFSPHLFPNDSRGNGVFQSTEMTSNHPDNFQLAKELRIFMDDNSHNHAWMVGETFGGYAALRDFCGRDVPDGLHLAFMFQSAHASFTAAAYRKLIIEAERWFPKPYCPTWVFGNHDMNRRITRLKGDWERAKLDAAFQLTVRGVPFFYNGEEIGMENGCIPIAQAQDGVTKHFRKHFPDWVLSILNKQFNGAVNRDNCRTPLQWDSSVHAGFSTTKAEPWIRINRSAQKNTIASEQANADSLLHCVSRFLKVRSEFEALKSGSLILQPDLAFSPQVLAFCRKAELEKDIFLVLLNFSDKNQRVDISQLSTFRPKSNEQDRTLTIIVSTSLQVDRAGVVKNNRHELNLSPWEGCVLQYS
jgi:alpha-glucosidase